MNSKLEIKCQKIKLVLTDVDGVLTDGGMYYSKSGDIMKKFHARDGMGAAILKRNNILTIVVTKEKNDIIRQWVKNMPISEIFEGVQDKKTVLHQICNKYSVTPEEIAYIGDDINDKELLREVGLSACPNDGIDDIKKFVDYVCMKKGGDASFREFSELILSVHK